MGAALLLVADWLSQRLAATAQLPVGLVTGYWVVATCCG
jgi:iron complex transport system permease protein